MKWYLTKIGYSLKESEIFNTKREAVNNAGNCGRVKRWGEGCYRIPGCNCNPACYIIREDIFIKFRAIKEITK